MQAYNEALNKMAIQFSLAHREEKQLLREEIEWLRSLLTAVIWYAGGEVSVYIRDLEALKVARVDYFEAFRDDDNRRWALRIRSAPKDRVRATFTKPDGNESPPCFLDGDDARIK